jgi:hypothetical protein
MRRLPRPPRGRMEYDFCQMQFKSPRVSIRKNAGIYEVYSSAINGAEAILFSSRRWAQAYIEGKDMFLNLWGPL